MSKASSSNTLDSSAGSFYKSFFNEIFTNLTLRSGSNEHFLSFNAMEDFLCLPHFVSRNICRVLDTKFKGSLSQHDFVEGIHTLYRGDIEHQLEMVFRIMDLDNDGAVDRDDLNLFLIHLNMRSIANENILKSLDTKFSFPQFSKVPNLGKELLSGLNVHMEDLDECVEFYKRCLTIPNLEDLKDSTVYFGRTCTKIKPYLVKQIGKFIFQLKVNNDVYPLKNVYMIISTFLRFKSSILIDGKISNRVTLVSQLNGHSDELTLYYDSSHFIDTLIAQINYKKIDEHLELYQEVGVSQIGTLYKGRMIKTDEEVTVKVFNKTKFNLNYIKYESNIFELLRNNCDKNTIIPVEKFEEPERVYFVYENIEEDLESYLMKRKKLMEPSELKQMTMDILEGLKFLHANGVVHRDLTVESLVICSDNNLPVVKIFGFAYAKVIGSCEGLTNYYGPSWYSAPEVLMKVPFNFGVDVWSLGIIIYYLRYGRFPYDPDNINISVVTNSDLFEYEHTSGHYEANSGIDCFIQSCLAKDPNRRLAILGLTSVSFNE